MRRRDLHRRAGRGAGRRRRLQPRDRDPLARRRRGGPRPRGAGRGRRRSPRRLHAHRDAARAARQALELWPEDEAEELRLETLRALRALRRAGRRDGRGRESLARAGRRAATGAATARATREAQRRLAAVYELGGERDAAFAARRLAAEAFAAAELPAEAALERLAMADHHRRGARYGGGDRAGRGSPPRRRAPAERVDLAPGCSACRAWRRRRAASSSRGWRRCSAGLALALEEDLTPVAAELYQRLSLVLYDGADYRQRRGGARHRPRPLPHRRRRRAPRSPASPASSTCCASAASGRGPSELGRELIDVRHRRLGRRGADRRDPRLPRQARLRPAAAHRLARGLLRGRPLQHVRRLDHRRWRSSPPPKGSTTRRPSYCRELLARWEESEDHHYAVWGMRWAASYFAQRAERDGRQRLRRGAEPDGRRGAATPTPLAALAQALGELALLEGDEAAAAEHLSRAVELHRNLAIPHERAQIELRAGVALAAAGEREEALERLCDAYRCATQARRPARSRPTAAQGGGGAGRVGGAAARQPRRGGLRRRRRS